MGVIEWPTVSCLERGWAMGEQELNKIVSIKKKHKKLKKKKLTKWVVFVLLGTVGSTDAWTAGHG